MRRNNAGKVCDKKRLRCLFVCVRRYVYEDLNGKPIWGCIFVWFSFVCFLLCIEYMCNAEYSRFVPHVITVLVALLVD